MRSSSGPGMSWWTADSWCRKKGKNLVSVSTLGCTANAWDNYSGTSCSSSTVNSLWSGYTYYWLSDMSSNNNAQAQVLCMGNKKIYSYTMGNTHNALCR